MCGETNKINKQKQQKNEPDMCLILYENTIKIKETMRRVCVRLCVYVCVS